MQSKKIRRRSFLFLGGAVLAKGLTLALPAEAMNLDGGASRALAAKGRILVPAGRELTNAIVVYDAQHPAPNDLKQDWMRFQGGANASDVTPAPGAGNGDSSSSGDRLW